VTDSIPFVDFGGSGEVLHFAHPNAYTPECFSRFLAPLAEQFHVLALLQRPLWPNSDPAEMTDWRLLADDLIRFLDQESLRDVVGMGHSLGAVITMMAAIKRPDLFSRLVLIEPVFLPQSILQRIREHPEQAWNSPRVSGALRRRNKWASRQEAFDRFHSKSIFARFSDELLWDYINHSLDENEDGSVSLRFSPEWEAQIYAHDPPFVWDELPNVTHATLGLRGAETDVILPEAWALWQQLQPNATFAEVADVGHMMTMERPSAVAKVVLDYLC